MLSRRSLLAAPAALIPTAFARNAFCEPRVGASFPTFSVRDLTDAWHNDRELHGRRTFAVAITGPGAGPDMGHWFNNARARFGTNRVRMIALVAFHLSWYAWDGIVRSQARARTPQWRWRDTWLDRDGNLQRALGLGNDSNVPWAFVIEGTGMVSAATHAIASHPTAQNIWTALGAP